MQILKTTAKLKLAAATLEEQNNGKRCMQAATADRYWSLGKKYNNVRKYYPIFPLSKKFTTVSKIEQQLEQIVRPMFFI